MTSEYQVLTHLYSFSWDELVKAIHLLFSPNGNIWEEIGGGDSDPSHFDSGAKKTAIATLLPKQRLPLEENKGQSVQGFDFKHRKNCTFHSFSKGHSLNLVCLSDCQKCHKCVFKRSLISEIILSGCSLNVILVPSLSSLSSSSFLTMVSGHTLTHL